MTIDNDSRAAKSFYREIRKFAERAKAWDVGVVWYETKPDERHDPSLVSARVYGRRDESLAVLAAAGLDGFDQTLTERMLALPSDLLLSQIKRACNFESIAPNRARRPAADAQLPEAPSAALLPAIPGGGGGGGGGGDGGDAALLIAAHEAAADPHPQYVRDNEVLDGGVF